MSDIILTDITSGYQLSKINDNFDKIEEVINDEVMHTVGGNNVMHQNLDMNSFSILNADVDPNDPNSMLTVGVADGRYYNVAGDTLTGTMQVNNQTITGLKAPVGPTEAVRKVDLDNEAASRAQGDASLQDQLNGTNPPMGSAFSIISWHDQIITNSINIPAGKNAWSFGPTITLALGQVVEIGLGSFWTVANGAVAGTGVLTNEIPDPLDMGVL